MSSLCWSFVLEYRKLFPTGKPMQHEPAEFGNLSYIHLQTKCVSWAYFLKILFLNWKIYFLRTTKYTSWVYKVVMSGWGSNVLSNWCCFGSFYVFHPHVKHYRVWIQFWSKPQTHKTILTYALPFADHSKYGIPSEELSAVKTVDAFFDCLERHGLLSEDDLHHLQYLLHQLKKRGAISAVDNYAKNRATNPIILKKIKRRTPGKCVCLYIYLLISCRCTLVYWQDYSYTNCFSHKKAKRSW